MKTYTFDELPVGFSETLSVAITEEDIDGFVRLSSDNSPIHVDDEYAVSRGFNGRIAPGMLTAAYISALIGTRLPGKYGLLQGISCQFRRPCYAPNVLTIRGVVSRRSEGLKLVTIDISVLDQGGQEIVRAQANCLLAC